MWNSERTSTEGQESFFSYYVVKDGEFMKLSFAIQDIVSTGFTRYWRRPSLN